MRGRLVANAELETSRAPVHKLDSALGFNDTDCRINVLRNDITTVKEGTSHWEIMRKLILVQKIPRTIFALPRITLDHLVASLEAGEGHICNRVLLVMSLVC